MNKDDFLIRNSTGIIFQISGMGDNISLVRLMDFSPYKNSESVVLSEFKHVPYGDPLWDTLFEFKKKLMDKDSNVIKMTNDGKIEIYPIHLINDPMFNQISQNLRKLTYRSFRPNIDENSSKTPAKPKRSNNRMTIVRTEEKEVEEENLGDDPQLMQPDDIEINITYPNPQDNLEQIILHPQTREALEQALVKIEYKQLLQDDWAPSGMSKNKAKSCALNFFGPPGTGKTISVKALASTLNKPIIQVDFSALLSKWVGGTGKNIKKYFDTATEIGAILFFDEADTLLQSRSNMSGMGDTTNIQNQNIFMQELDKFDGIVVLTTNHFKNYDEAQVRRLTHIEFLLPTEEMREKIIKNHLPANLHLESVTLVSTIAKMTNEFSGADLSNLVEQTLLSQLMNIRKNNMNKTKEEVSELIKQSVFNLSSFKAELDKINYSKKSFKGLNLNSKNISLV